VTHIDINCDMGEVPEAIADGTQESLMPNLTSVNIACGGHAGDEETMRITVAQALRHGLSIGAHPGYPDRANFGRLELEMSLEVLAESICRQIAALAAVVDRAGAKMTHVKPHGALYNQAVKNRALARAIAGGVARFEGGLALIGLAGSPMLDVFRDAGFTVAAEAFADRRYEPDGSLRPRRFEDALIRDPEQAAAQALRIATEGRAIASNGAEIALRAETICIHGDTPGSPDIAAAVARRLREQGVRLVAVRK
jgi:5-oxoprolinase (ATP-hydrolysing) subunit A